VRDVVVIGAGPAGALTARRLAERGHDVVMLEEHAAVGTPVHCTGLLGLEAFAEFDLPRETILGFAESARFWGAAGQSVAVRSDRIRATVIDRAAFDTALAGRAEVAGVTVRRGWRAEAITVGPSGVVVRNAAHEEPVEARACVLACGANYRFHRQLGLGVPTVFLQSAQLETPFPRAEDVEVRFGRSVAPAGFGWLVPLERRGVPHARIGLMSETRSRERFGAFLAALCRRVGLDVASVPAPRLKMLPLGPIRQTYAERVLAVGDAAGLVKPTTGGGIYYGLLSAALAADVLDEALRQDRLSDAHLRRYETGWRRRLGSEIRVGLAFRRIASRLSDESIDSLIELARVNGIVPLLQQTASFNWHSRAAIALLADASFRRIVLKSWCSAGPI
jgi:digeranylgeranylglycerophospholipid reductase